MNHRFLHLSLRVGLLLCALLWVVGLRGQTPCAPTTLFRLEVMKAIVCGTTTAHLDFTPFQAHITEIVPPPSSSPERLSPPKSRASFVKDGTDYNMGRLVLRTVHGRGQHLMRYWIESYTPVAGVTPQALPPIGSRDTPPPVTMSQHTEQGIM